MEIIFKPLGDFQTNCYVAMDPVSKDGLIIDPGQDKSGVDELLLKTGVNLKAVLLTHGHLDHGESVNYVIDKYPDICLYMHRGDYEFMKSDTFLFAKPPAEDRIVFIRDNDNLKFGNLKFKVIETPGHSKGSVCYLNDKTLFSGDTIFRQAYGRYDLAGGDFNELMDSIGNKLMTLDESTIVYPGHGISTTISIEKGTYNL